LIVLYSTSVAVRRYVSGLKADGAPERSLQALAAIDLRLLVLGHGIPAVLAGCVALGVPGAESWMIAAGLLTVAGGWLFKYTLVRRAAFTRASRSSSCRCAGAARPVRVNRVGAASVKFPGPCIPATQSAACMLLRRPKEKQPVKRHPSRRDRPRRLRQSGGLIDGVAANVKVRQGAGFVHSLL
jgi:hypothetical protein